MGTKTCFDQILLDGPVAAYLFDESGGSTVAEDSANSYDAAYTSSPGLFKGKLGRRCITLDGTSHVVIPELISDFSNGMTIEIMIAPTSIVANSAIIGLSNGIDINAVELFRDASNNNVSLKVGSTTITTTSGSILTTKYTHIVATITNAGAAVVYMDGSSGVSGSVDSLGSTSSRATNYIGKGVITGHALMPSNVVFAAVYDKVLTSSDVSDHYDILYPEEFGGISFPPVRIACLGTAKTSKKSGSVIVAKLQRGDIGEPWQNSSTFANKTVSGTVLEQGSPSSRMVKVFRNDRPEVLLGQAMSDAITGSFSIGINSYDEEVIVIAYDDDASPVRNAQIYSKVMGV
jgi:hypothetical protein